MKLGRLQYIHSASPGSKVLISGALMMVSGAFIILDSFSFLVTWISECNKSKDQIDMHQQSLVSSLTFFDVVNGQVYAGTLYISDLRDRARLSSVQSRKTA